MCQFENEREITKEGQIISCDGCNLEIRIDKLNPLQIRPISEWYYYYGGGG